MAERWIQKAIKNPGALRRMLGIKKGEKIPEEVLKRLAEAEVGSKVKVNGTKTVTPLLKRRVVLARSLKKLSKKKKEGGRKKKK